MKPTEFRTLFTLFLSLILFQLHAEILFDKDEIKERLETMDCIVKPRYDHIVESYIKGYLARDARKAKMVLSRTVTYFPIFEKYLEEHDMPDDLKYLSVVESALSPLAVSRVGATGLWQFMKETGAAYGLKINRSVDERSCPHSSTRAAMEYLAKAYARFGSWELAIASYNCGAGNINRAIRRSGTKDYWSLSKYLPRETRNFVPAFLGAAYVLKYYHLHGIVPEYPDLDMQLLEATPVYHQLQLETVAAVTGIPLEVISELNPAFKRGYVPAYEQGHYILLPSRVVQAFRDYLHVIRPDNGSVTELPPLPELPDTSQYDPGRYYYHAYFTAAKGNRLSELGKMFNCSGYHLRAWNNLTKTEIDRRQELIVWMPREILRYQPFGEKVRILPPTRRKPGSIPGTRPEIPRIQPLQPAKLSPVKSGGHPDDLPFSAMSMAEANLKRFREEIQTREQEKPSTIRKIRQWMYRKNPFKKKE